MFLSRQEPKMTDNQHKDVIIDKYNEYDEEARLVSNRGHNMEYLTTMRYIEKFLKPGIKILEIGAGTGRYSITLAQKGYDVTAVDLTPKHVEIMTQKANGLKNFRCMVADALDLSMFEDNSFDMVLNFGPMYHLFHQKDKEQAVKETIRVAQKGGICMFAYLPCASFVTGYGLLNQDVAHVCAAMDDTGRMKDVPEEVFTGFYIEDFKKLFDKTNTKYITNVATDGLGYTLQDMIEKLPEKEYQAFLKWHFMTCERPDQQGYSAHLLYICEKLG